MSDVDDTVCVTLQLLLKNPSQRLGMPTCPAGAIRDHAFFKPIDWQLIENRQMEPPVKPKIVRRAVLLSIKLVLALFLR
jgi:hypothetical protein